MVLIRKRDRELTDASLSRSVDRVLALDCSSDNEHVLSRVVDAETETHSSAALPLMR